MNTLSELLSSRVKAEIFRLLFGLRDQELHVREMERQSGLTDATVRQELKRLTRLGLVERRRDGNRVCYRAHRQHPLYLELHNLVLKTTGLVEVLREALTHDDIAVAFVFGSVARSEEKAQSDVDLMVIGSIRLRQLTKLLSGVAGQIGREINPHIMTQKEFCQRQNARDHFLTTVLSDSRLFVKGSDDELETMGR